MARRQVFVSQDPKLRAAISESGVVRFFNPREDRIPIEHVDVVITERAWIEKRYERSSKWDGKFISTKTSDSKPESADGGIESELGCAARGRERGVQRLEGREP
jgi:hypothetical protein